MSDKWKTVTIGSLITKRSDRNHPELPLLSVVRSKGVIVRDISSKAENHNFIPDDLSDYKLVMPGDLVINKMKAWSGSLGVSNWKGIVSPAYYVYSLGYKVPHYAHYLLRTSKFAEEFARCSDGVRVGQWDLSISAFKRIMVPVPSENEQKNIVKYLDHYMFAFNKAINAKITLINLLEEKKIRVIDSFVVSGRHERTDFRETSINWLGSIPSHWRLMKMKHLFKEKTVKGFPNEQLLVASQKYGVVTKKQYGLRTVVAEKDLKNLKLVEVNDFVVSLRSFQGGIEVSHARGIISPAYTVLQLVDDKHREYFTYLLKSTSFIEALKLSVTGIREGQNVDYKRLRNEFLPLPPVEEQDAIVARIRVETEGIEFAISAIKNEISLMREHKERLIRDVTMGHVNVQELAQNLPEIELDAIETPESEVEFEDD